MSNTWSATYTDTDIGIVMRRFKSDLLMIAQSSGAETQAKARDYAHDIEIFAKAGYLNNVDVTLLDGEREIRAVRYVVEDSAGNLEMVRPGGVMWPRVNDPVLRVVVFHTNDYTPSAEKKLSHKLKIGWTDSHADTSHASLTQNGDRSYNSNGWGMQRTDYA